MTRTFENSRLKQNLLDLPTSLQEKIKQIVIEGWPAEKGIYHTSKVGIIGLLSEVTVFRRMRSYAHIPLGEKELFATKRNRSLDERLASAPALRVFALSDKDTFDVQQKPVYFKDSQDNVCMLVSLPNYDPRFLRWIRAYGLGSHCEVYYRDPHSPILEYLTFKGRVLKKMKSHIFILRIPARAPVQAIHTS